MKILLAIHHRFELWNAPPWLGPRLQERFSEHQFVQLNGFEGFGEEIADAEILIAWQLRPEQFRAARKLCWIHATTAAVHQLMFPELVASDVRVTNSTEIHGPVVAEHALALMFALAKGLPAAARYQAARHWGQTDLWRSVMRPRELSGATLGVVGLGAIGRESVRLATAMGMKVIAMREHPERGSEGADLVLGPDRFGELLKESDYVLLAAPLTSKTDKLFRNETFAFMRKDACFVNVSRGALVDEAALEHVLREHTIRAAALDVFETEPLPADSPLWQLDNLLITPHSAALTDKLWDRHFLRITENFRRYLNREPLLGEVNKLKGY